MTNNNFKKETDLHLCKPLDEMPEYQIEHKKNLGWWFSKKNEYICVIDFCPFCGKKLNDT